MKRAILLLLSCLMAGCGSSCEDSIDGMVREVGTIPNPPGAGGRDVGFSVLFGGHSVWVFGDTFFADAASDGYHWRASTWSFTDDMNASDGLDPFTHALGADKKPLALLPHTAEEQAWNDTHNGSPCPAGDDCGGRHTIWPGAVVVDPASGGALVFASTMVTHTTSAFDFHSTGTLIATWASPDEAALRPVVRPDLADPTVLFPVEEPPWGAAALISGEHLYAYACPGGGLSSPCRVARAVVGSALDRAAWRFWDGSNWVIDWREAVDVLDGAPLMTVHFNGHLKKLVAFYMVPLTPKMAFSTADRPEGPWSEPRVFGEGAAAPDGAFDYALAAHPELSPDGGRTEYLSYFQPGTFLNGIIHLVEVKMPNLVK